MNNHIPYAKMQPQSMQTQQQSHAHIRQQQQQQRPQQKYQANPLHPSLISELDPAFLKLYNDYIATSPPPSTDINVVRSNYSVLYSYATAPASGVGGIGETTVPGWAKYPGEISVRVYVPPGEEPGQRKVWPVHFNFHGGGWACGDLETSAHICHHICANVHCCVIDVSYRLIPEYPFPIGIFDSLSAVAHILINHRTFSIDPHNITLGGESSGGTIALALSHIFRDAGEQWSKRLKGVVVGTPSICDLRRISTAQESPFESMRDSERMPLLNWQKLKWFDSFKWMSLTAQPPGLLVPQLQSPQNDINSRKVENVPRPNHKQMMADVSWYANLLTAPNHKDLAPLTYIATAEFDPLRDEGETYAQILRENGNNVVTTRFMGVPHSFMHMDGVLRQGKEYSEEVINNIRTCLYPPEANEGSNTGKEKEGLKQSNNAHDQGEDVGMEESE